jgi:hypothetical protein
MKSFRNSVLIPLFFALSGSAAIPISAIAQELSQGYFVKAPRLVTATTTFNSVRARGAKYYFNIVIPEDAGNNLQQVVIALRQGQDDIKYRLEKTVAYLGTNRDKGEQLVVLAYQSDTTGEIIVTFKNPLPPGTAFTVGLRPNQNPDYAGVYVYGVTAIPEGNKPTPLYLGSRGLRFYRGGNSRH